MFGVNLSTVKVYDATTIEIKNLDNGNRQVVLDGKKLDLSKVRKMRITIDCDGMIIESDIIGGSMPIKE